MKPQNQPNEPRNPSGDTRRSTRGRIVRQRAGLAAGSSLLRRMAGGRVVGSLPPVGTAGAGQAAAAGSKAEAHPLPRFRPGFSSTIIPLNKCINIGTISTHEARP